MLLRGDAGDTQTLEGTSAGGLIPGSFSLQQTALPFLGGSPSQSIGFELGAAHSQLQARAGTQVRPVSFSLLLTAAMDIRHSRAPGFDPRTSIRSAGKEEP